MFSVKEYKKDWCFIRSTGFACNQQAVKLAKEINKSGDFNAIVTEIDHDEKGNVWELIVYKGDLTREDLLIIEKWYA